MMTRRKVLTWVLLAAWICPVLFFVARQWQDEVIVSRYLAENGLQQLSMSRESVIRISKFVRQDFENDESKFVFLDLANRPFLREPAGQLLTHREGLCDAGTRVMVNLLTKQGYDATRVTLYNKHLESSHTLVSVLLDGEEFLVDSMGSPPEVTKLTMERNIAPQMFDVLHYTDNILRRRAFTARGYSEDLRAFFDHYWLYSYEALPITKILSRLGIDMRVFNLRRPPVVLSVLAEKPYLVQAIVWFSVMGMVFLVFLRWSRHHP